MSSGEVINMEKIADDLSIFHTGLWLILFFPALDGAKLRLCGWRVCSNGGTIGDWNVFSVCIFHVLPVNVIFQPVDIRLVTRTGTRIKGS